MRTNSGSDWRDELPFESPVTLALVMPGGAARCAVCGPASEALDREQLLAYKHRHPGDHSGYVRFYCRAHVPAAVSVAAPSATAGAARRSAGARAPRSAAAERAPRRTVVEVPAAVCPNCFVEVAANGVCGSCGERVA